MNEIEIQYARAAMRSFAGRIKPDLLPKVTEWWARDLIKVDPTDVHAVIDSRLRRAENQWMLNPPPEPPKPVMVAATRTPEPEPTPAPEASKPDPVSVEPPAPTETLLPTAAELAQMSPVDRQAIFAKRQEESLKRIVPNFTKPSPFAGKGIFNA